MCSANGRIEISNERHCLGQLSPTPFLSPAWCHLSSVSLKKGHDYDVSIWKLPRWGSEPDPSSSRGGGGGAGHTCSDGRHSSLGSFTDKLDRCVLCLPLAPSHRQVTGLLPAVPPQASHSWQLEVTHLSWLGCCHKRPFTKHTKGDFSLSPGLQAPKCLTFQELGERRGSCGF